VVGPVDGGVEVVEGEVRLGCTGEVDGVAAGVLLVSAVVGLDRLVEAADRLCVVTEVERGRSGDHLDLPVGHPVQDIGVIGTRPVVEGVAGLVEQLGACLAVADLGVRAGGPGGEHCRHPCAAQPCHGLACCLQEGDRLLCLAGGVALHRQEGQGVGPGHRVAGGR
jgi:hypothetical protein